MGRQRFGHFLRFKTVKYERPHPKTWEVPALVGTKRQMAFHFKALKCYQDVNMDKEGLRNEDGNKVDFETGWVIGRLKWKPLWAKWRDICR